MLSKIQIYRTPAQLNTGAPSCISFAQLPPGARSYDVRSLHIDGFHHHRKPIGQFIGFCSTVTIIKH